MNLGKHPRFKAKKSFLWCERTHRYVDGEVSRFFGRFLVVVDFVGLPERNVTTGRRLRLCWRWPPVRNFLLLCSVCGFVPESCNSAPSL